MIRFGAGVMLGVAGTLLAATLVRGAFQRTRRMELAQRDLNDEVDELHERIRELEMRRALKFGKKFAVLKRPARKIARKKFAQPTRAAA